MEMNEPLCEHQAELLTVHELDELRAHIRQRSSGWVRNLRLLVRGRGLVLQGHVSTYYAKQLAQQAIMEASSLPILANEIEVRRAHYTG